VFEGATQPIQLTHLDRITGLNLIQQFTQGGPLLQRGSLFLDHLLAAVGPQGVELQVQLLLLGGYPRIAPNHRSISKSQQTLRY
jgi:hypothetical protein